LSDNLKNILQQRLNKYLTFYYIRFAKNFSRSEAVIKLYPYTISKKYLCPICNTYTTNDVPIKIPIQLIREIIFKLKSQGWDVKLDESEFCHQCHPNKIQNPSLIFKIRYSPKDNYHIVRSNSLVVYIMIQSFLEDKFNVNYIIYRVKNRYINTQPTMSFHIKRNSHLLFTRKSLTLLESILYLRDTSGSPEGSNIDSKSSSPVVFFFDSTSGSPGGFNNDSTSGSPEGSNIDSTSGSPRHSSIDSTNAYCKIEKSNLISMLRVKLKELTNIALKVQARRRRRIHIRRRQLIRTDSYNVKHHLRSMRPRRPPITYLCPICGTLTIDKYYKNVDIGMIRGLIQELQSLDWDVLLDETELCPFCRKEISDNPILTFKIRFDDKDKYNIYKTNRYKSYDLMYDFLTQYLITPEKDVDIDSIPLSDLSIRKVSVLKKMLGLEDINSSTEY
jgi:hypothetical protein